MENAITYSLITGFFFLRKCNIITLLVDISVTVDTGYQVSKPVTAHI